MNKEEKILEWNFSWCKAFWACNLTPASRLYPRLLTLSRNLRSSFQSMQITRLSNMAVGEGWISAVIWHQHKQISDSSRARSVQDKLYFQPWQSDKTVGLIMQVVWHQPHGYYLSFCTYFIIKKNRRKKSYVACNLTQAVCFLKNK